MSTPETNLPGRAIANASSSGYFGRLASFALVQTLKIVSDILKLGDIATNNGSLPVEIQGGFRLPIVSKTTTYPATVDDATILGDTTSAGFTITLPSPSATTPKQIMAVKKIAAANVLTVATAAGTIDGASTIAIPGLNNVVIFQSDGTNWQILSNSSAFGTSPQWIKFTVTHTQLQTAALTNSITLYSLPAGMQIHATKIKHSTAFAGTAITAYSVSVGVSGDTERFASFFDVFQSVANTTLGIASALDCVNQGAATTIQISAVSVGGNLSASTAGSVDVWLLVSLAT